MRSTNSTKSIAFTLISILLFGSWAQGQAPAPGKKTFALFAAIRSGSVDALQKQIDAGADVNDTLYGRSALMSAATCGSVEQMELLIGRGAAVNFQASDSITALWYAAPDFDKMKLLLTHGANPNQSVDGYGILAKVAMMPGTLPVFELMVAHGCELKKMAVDNSLLYNAASSGDTALIGFLIDHGFNVNDSVLFSDYPIINAEAFRSFSAVKMLVDHGANVNVRQWNVNNLDAFKGFTSLMFASLQNDTAAVIYLLEHGADPNTHNKNGYTALMLLEQSESDEPSTIEAFAKHGANIWEQAPDGTDALFYARQKGNTASVMAIEKYPKK